MESKQQYDPGAAHWHIDKRVNVGHLITTLMLAASVFAWGSAIDRRVAIVEASVVQNEKDNARQDVALKESATLIRDDLRMLKEEIRELGRKLEDSPRYKNGGR